MYSTVHTREPVGFQIALCTNWNSVLYWNSSFSLIFLGVIYDYSIREMLGRKNQRCNITIREQSKLETRATGSVSRSALSP